ncbi:hypothetical protein SynA1825c_02483 [Synechococcus sp. A18-25c]|nr:hypothetical protein SynA1825c_02483 [Synechococcus sp. A18-25c]
MLHAGSPSSTRHGLFAKWCVFRGICPPNSFTSIAELTVDASIHPDAT